MLRYLPAWALRSICVVAHPIVGTSLLIVVVADLALGGNGYLIKIGPLRIRELLYIGCMSLTSLCYLIPRRRHQVFDISGSPGML